MSLNPGFPKCQYLVAALDRLTIKYESTSTEMYFVLTYQHSKSLQISFISRNKFGSNTFKIPGEFINQYNKTVGCYQIVIL